MKLKELCCFKCGNEEEDLVELYGFHICGSCRSTLGLLRDETIRRHIVQYDRMRIDDPSKPSYVEEILARLAFIEKDFASKKIKLSHVLSRLSTMEC